jgi:hypothetical protein
MIVPPSSDREFAIRVYLPLARDVRNVLEM